MNKVTHIAAAALTVAAGGALAADLPAQKGPPVAAAPAAVNGFDFAFGAKAMSDYVVRGISNSDRAPSLSAYGELRYNIGDTQLYAGIAPTLVRLPTAPAAEVDLTLGVRQTWGAFAVDVGAIYYLYPGNRNQYWTNGVAGVPGGFTALNPIGATAATCAGAGAAPPVGVAGLCATTPRDPSFFELYLKPSYNITDAFNVGGNLYWSPNWNNYKFQGTYLSGTAKYTFGDSGFSVSGEFGRVFLGSLKPGTIFNAGPASFKYPSYNTWNAGVSYAWKNATLDLRYHGSDLNKSNCWIVSADHNGNPNGPGFRGTSNWCGHRFMASLAVDFVYSKDVRK
jgi:hypothetical protein